MMRLSRNSSPTRPPAAIRRTGLKLGLFTGPRLDAIADLAFGWPEA